MSFVIADRVKETTTTSGTGTVSLLGASTGYQSFSAGIGDGNSTYYCIASQTLNTWEVGIGTYTSSGSTLSRTTVLNSSSGVGTLVNFGSETKDVFVTYPAEKSVNQDTSGNVTITGGLTAAGSLTLSGGTANGVLYLNGSKAVTSGSALAFDGTTLTASNINSSGQLTLTNASNWNVYASGAGANYFNGALNVGTTSLSTQTQITFSGNAPQSSGTAYFVITNPTFTSSTTSAGQLFRSGLVTQAASFTMAQYNAYICSASSIGSGSSVTNSYGFQVASPFTQTGMTNVYAFNGGLSSGTGIWNLYNNGTAANYMAGQLVVGSTTLTNGFVDFAPSQSTNTYQFRVAGTNTNTNSAIFGTVLGGTLTGTSSTTSAYVTQIGGIFNVASGATVNTYYGLDVQPSLNGTATPTNITLNRAFLNLGALSTGATSNLYNYASNNIIANASSTATITNAYGFIHNGFSTSNSVTIGTAYAFYGNQSTSGATSAWNLYMAGNAPNYMAGSLTVVGGIAGGSF